MKTDKYSIYRLIDPIYFVTKYVGLSHQEEYRLRQHLSLKENNPQKNTWLKNVKDLGEMAIMEILDKAIGRKEAQRKEAFWIDYYRRCKAPLTNIVYPIHSMPQISPTSPGLVEFDMPLWRGEFFLKNLYNAVGPLVTVNGVVTLPTIDQIVVYTDTWNEREWINLVLKFGRRALMDGTISSYRYSIYTYSWAVFGDDTFLDRREQVKPDDQCSRWDIWGSIEERERQKAIALER